jgi:hypothetical protein
MGVKVRPERGLMVRRITGDERLSYDELPIFLQDLISLFTGPCAARCADSFEFIQFDNSNTTALMM